MIVRYLRLTLWPTSLVVNYGWPVPLRLRDVWPQSIVVIGLLVGTLVALVKRPAVGFVGAWFFLTLAPTSSFMPIATEVGAERRMYVPLMAIVALAVVGIRTTWQQLRDRPGTRGQSSFRRENVAGWITVTAIAVAFAIGTMIRNREYRSGITLADTSVARWPSSVGEHVLGTQWALAGNPAEAKLHFQRAVPGAPRAYFSLAAIEFEEQQWDAAIRDFRAFVDAQPLLFEAIAARLHMAQALSSRSQWADAIEQARLVLTMRPSRDDALEARLVIAGALRGQESYDAAVAQYQTYVQARPNDVRGATGLAISLVGLNRTEDAAAWFTRAADLAPDDPAMQRNAAMALLELRRVDEAVLYAERAARMRPNDDLAHDVFGQVLLAQRKSAAAIEQFQLALRLSPNDAEIRAHLDQALRWSRTPY
jgi:tetratricopeptide (TPR) repeat protein